MFGRKKMYKRGIADALKANEDFSKKQEDALNFMREEVRVGSKSIETALHDTMTKLDANIHDLYAYLTSKEKAALYHLATPYDLKTLSEENKQLLLAVLYQLANDQSEEGLATTSAQQNYIRSIKKYLEIANPQSKHDDLSVVGDIDSIAVQRVFYQVALEYFYLHDNDALLLSQEQFLAYFALREVDKVSIEEMVGRSFCAVGPEGIAEKYGYVPEEEPYTLEEAPSEPERDDVNELFSQNAAQSNVSAQPMVGSSSAESVYDSIFLALKNRGDGELGIRAFAETADYCLIRAEYGYHTRPLIIYNKKDKTYTDIPVMVYDNNIKVYDNCNILVLSAKNNLVAIELVDKAEHRIGAVSLDNALFHEVVSDPEATLLTCADGKIVYMIGNAVCIYDYFKEQYLSIECHASLKKAAAIKENHLFLLSGGNVLYVYDISNASIIRTHSLGNKYASTDAALSSFMVRFVDRVGATTSFHGFNPLIVTNTHYILVEGQEIYVFDDSLIRKNHITISGKIRRFDKEIVWTDANHQLSALLPDSNTPIKLATDADDRRSFVVINNWFYYCSIDGTTKKVCLDNPTIHKSVRND